ncbi:MAG TPA: biopolymer transporter ExbD [Steroidobacteraceae bacterium]|nr:biopolymer transporter ExbD [Steroidobacteraceae bacterium]
MSMQVGGSDDESMVDINTTPLIDVMLVLLIMFIITIPVMTHAVKLDMPRGATQPPPIPPEIIELEVDFDGTYLWNGTPVTDEGTLLSYLQNAASKDPQPEIHLRPNKRAKYDYVAKVLAASQRLGVRKIGFVGNEQFME